MTRWCSAFVALALVACSPGEATPGSTGSSPTTLVEIAPPTTVTATTATPSTAATPTTTSATTTSSTVDPTTTAASTPTERAESEIRTSLAALDGDFDGCFGAPDECGVDALLDRYFAADDDDVRPVYRDVWSDLKEKNEVKIWKGRVDRTIVWVTADAEGAVGTSYHCELDDTINVPKQTPAGASTTVNAEHETGYIRYYYEWQQRPDGSWVIVHSEMGVGTEPGVLEFGEMPSLTEDEIAECF